MLVNLVKNALKFSFGKPVAILARYNHEKQFLEVHIQDKGQGINERGKQRLFTLFGKLNDTDGVTGSSEMNKEGIGMGLSICKKIVERANGKIDCFSKGFKQGSTFIFTMKMPLPRE